MNGKDEADVARITKFLKGWDKRLATSLTRMQVERLITGFMHADLHGDALEIRENSFASLPRLRDVIAAPLPLIIRSPGLPRRLKTYRRLVGREFVEVQREYADA